MKEKKSRGTTLERSQRFNIKPRNVPVTKYSCSAEFVAQKSKSTLTQNVYEQGQIGSKPLGGNGGRVQSRVSVRVDSG